MRTVGILSAAIAALSLALPAAMAQEQDCLEAIAEIQAEAAATTDVTAANTALEHVAEAEAAASAGDEATCQEHAELAREALEGGNDAS